MATLGVRASTYTLEVGRDKHSVYNTSNKEEARELLSLKRVEASYHTCIAMGNAFAI